ncbi:enkurin-like [Lampetra planeri]
MYPPENNHNHLAQKEAAAEKSPRCISKFSPMVIRENRSTKSAMKIMGPAKAESTSPERNQTKHSKEPRLPEKTKCSKELQCTRNMRTSADKPPTGIYTKRDVTQTKRIKKPQPAFVDSYNGHKVLLENSGLIPKYIKKKHYGEVPGYLQQQQQHNKDKQSAQEEKEMLMEEQKKQAAMKGISQEEVPAMLKTLMKTWNKLRQDYQKLPFFADTPSKKFCRRKFEASMKQLEREIELMEMFQASRSTVSKGSPAYTNLISAT